jgi:hypothetical protein
MSHEKCLCTDMPTYRCHYLLIHVYQTLVTPTCKALHTVHASSFLTETCLCGVCVLAVTRDIIQVLISVQETEHDWRKKCKVAILGG